MRSRPALLTCLAFLVLMVAGTVVLRLWGFAPGTGRDLLDAAFTAVSAVSVTGLGVVDASTEMSDTGQALLLVLFQVGGLGVLTLSNWIQVALRRRLGVTGAAATRDTYGGLPRLAPRRILQRVLLFTFACEAVGTLLLFVRFAADVPAGRALWLAAFHAVSAFCNAGFSIFGDGLVAYQGDPWVNAVMVGLVVMGGIGFVAAVDVIERIRDRWRGRRRPLTYHTRIVLRTTAALTAAGAVLFLAFEWGNTMAPESLGEAALESVFLSVTARTAGFHTLATGHLTNMSLTLLLLLMMIGASPGSCGGGIKTTTFAVVWARVRSHVLNRTHTEMLGRSVPRQITAKAIAMVLIYALAAMLAMIALQATEFGEVPHDQSRGLFLEQLFEVVSALSTVGLSTGVTTKLTDAGLVVLMACMYVGRVGPLVLASSVIGERSRLAYRQPEADVMVG